MGVLLRSRPLLGDVAVIAGLVAVGIWGLDRNRVATQHARIAAELVPVAQRTLVNDRMIGTELTVPRMHSLRTGDVSAVELRRKTLIWIVDIETCQQCLVDLVELSMLAARDSLDLHVILVGPLTEHILERLARVPHQGLWSVGREDL
jgi:hypothetical protein